MAQVWIRWSCCFLAAHWSVAVLHPHHALLTPPQPHQLLRIAQQASTPLPTLFTSWNMDHPHFNTPLHLLPPFSNVGLVLPNNLTNRYMMPLNTQLVPCSLLHGFCWHRGFHFDSTTILKQSIITQEWIPACLQVQYHWLPTPLLFLPMAAPQPRTP